MRSAFCALGIVGIWGILYGLDQADAAECSDDDFPQDHADMQCYGLDQADAENAKQCRQRCCDLAEDRDPPHQGRA